jgi:hypothetical protein
MLLLLQTKAYHFGMWKNYALSYLGLDFVPSWSKLNRTPCKHCKTSGMKSLQQQAQTLSRKLSSLQTNSFF